MISLAATYEGMAEYATKHDVCRRPLLRKVTDRATGTTKVVPIPCGSTRESRCPACADKARRLRIQQCAEGWHLAEEPAAPQPSDDPRQADEDDTPEELGRVVRSTRRRQDVPDLPRVPVEDRTVGQTFTGTNGRAYRPSMFVTLTLPSYGPIDRDTGAPVDPSSYDYRRAAMDAMHFPRLFDRWMQNLRRCAGYKVQYFAAVEEQRRLAPHVHLAMRGAIPRALLRQVTRATYFQLWWPSVAEVVYPQDRLPIWDESVQGYVDSETRAVLPTFDEAMYELEDDNEATPAHVMRFGAQVDIQGIIAPSTEADRAIRYLTKYLSKGLSTTYVSDEESIPPAYAAHIERLHQEVRWLPCSPSCCNWLRYGVQPENAVPGIVPGRCLAPAHDRENLGLGGRRVLVSRKWSGKTLTQHRADRASVVRETLLAAGIAPPDVDRCAAERLDADGKPRFVWEDVEVTPSTYTAAILASVAERLRWRRQYDEAKAGPAPNSPPVDNRSATPLLLERTLS